MVNIEGPDVETALVAWTRDWFELLAAGRLADACSHLDEPNAHGIIWSPEAITQLVRETFAPGSKVAAAHPEGVRFTSCRAAAGRERFSLGAFDDGSGFWLDYGAPLNGEFSDLTAQFEFHWRGRDALAVRLHDLHVM